MNRVSLALLLVVACGLSPAMADTGTYVISDYRVTLTPQTDGQTKIAYHQQWKVTGGHIPWITVGTANDAFAIDQQSVGGNARSVRPHNAGNWSGVRIDLDADYQPGQTFEVKFALIQQGLFFEQGDNRYGFSFTPGWYDQAVTGKLTVTLHFFDDLWDVRIRPKPHVREARHLVWRRVDLRPGGRLDLLLSFPHKLFPKAIQSVATTSGQPHNVSGVHWIIGFGVVVLILYVGALVLSSMAKGASKYHGGGRVRYGGHVGHSVGHIPTCACACACVACACACACAGGGAAGCDRKLTRKCPLCHECENEDCPLRVRPVVAPI